MADLNNTIVRGKLRVTEDISANGSITGSSITLSSVKNAGILGTDSSGALPATHGKSVHWPFKEKAGTLAGRGRRYLGLHHHLCTLSHVQIAQSAPHSCPPNPPSCF